MVTEDILNAQVMLVNENFRANIHDHNLWMRAKDGLLTDADEDELVSHQRDAVDMNVGGTLFIVQSKVYKVGHVVVELIRNDYDCLFIHCAEDGVYST